MPLGEKPERMSSTFDDSAEYQPWCPPMCQCRWWASAVIPRGLRRQFPQIFWSGNADRLQVALTFDDDPDRRNLLPLLYVLARQRVCATFCYVGERVVAPRGCEDTRMRIRLTPYHLSPHVFASSHPLRMSCHSHKLRGRVNTTSFAPASVLQRCSVAALQRSSARTRPCLNAQNAPLL